MVQNVRPLSVDEARAFRLGRLLAAETTPYFAAALFATSPLAAPGLGTFAVDATWRLYMDPALLVGDEAWPTAQVAGVLAHEVGHLIRDHAARAAALPDVDHGAWNYAADAEINDDLIAAGVALPEGVITPAALGCADGDFAESYYQHTRALALPSPTSADSCGSGSGAAPSPGELPAGVSLDDPCDRPLAPADADMVRRRVAHAVTEATQASGRGTVPAGLSRWASGVLAPPTVSWQSVLSAAVRRAVSHAAGRTDYTYSRLSRRRVPRVVLPAMVGPKVRVSVVVDTSASMGRDELDAALSELRGVLSASVVDRSRVTLVSCDAAATVTRIRGLDSVELTGGGGTDMRVGITAAEEDRPHVIVVLSDGYTPWPDQPTRAHLVLGIIRHSTPTGTPRWATTVHIPPAQVRP